MFSYSVPLLRYHGGKYQFIKFHGIDFQGVGADITPPGVGAYFYNTTPIVDSFKVTQFFVV
jgi:mannan endo-1,4-beta-mannosidase